MNRLVLRACLFLALAVLAVPGASAHTRSQSASAWTIDGDTITGRVEADAVDVTRLYALGSGTAPMEEVFRRHVGDSFSIATPAGACTKAGEPEPTPSSTGRIAVRLAFECPAGALARGEIDIHGALFLPVAATHLHFLQVSAPSGAEAEAVITDTHRDPHLVLARPRGGEGAWGAFTRFLPIGMVHVWTGLDHIAFILGLVLLARTPLAAAIAASGFTLGHTATLALAALGVLQPHQATVESLIGFTVAFVALQASDADRLARWSRWIAAGLVLLAGIAWLDAAPVGAATHLGLALFVAGFGGRKGHAGLSAPWLAAVFGLIHGCGFAGALNELDLPRPRLLSALAGFNIGVEVAQVTVIVAAFLVGHLARRFANGRDLLAAALLSVGLYWFVSRAL